MATTLAGPKGWLQQEAATLAGRSLAAKAGWKHDVLGIEIADEVVRSFESASGHPT